ncbi:MAG: putative DNA binding domain-containing protein, partial [Sulfurovaceae bacterium]|nr:putative DNA binding domain-containing protein [Sulfurovaceae bacterium]
MIFDLQELQNAIIKGESQTVEFKTSFSKEAIESVVAFANANGGSIIIGVSDDSQVIGITISPETLKDYINQIKQNTQPNIIVDINDYIIQDKTVAIINIQEQPIKPIAYKNRYYKRVKNSNHQMSLDEITNEHFKTINASWDYCIDERHDFNDISMDKIINLVEKIEKYQNKTFEDDPMSILRKYELIKDGKLTFGAYLLFTSNVSAITSFQIGRFKSPTDIIDNIDIDTDIITQIDIAIEFIKKHLMTEFIITGE